MLRVSINESPVERESLASVIGCRLSDIDMWICGPNELTVACVDVTERGESDIRSIRVYGDGRECACATVSNSDDFPPH